MKRPLVAVVSFYVIGLLLAEIFQPHLIALFGISFVLFAFALFSQTLRPILICVLLALSGWINLLLHESIVSPNDLRTFVGSNPQIVTIRGTLIETPSARIFMRDEEEVRRSLAQVRVNSLRQNSATNYQPAVGVVVVTTPGMLPENYFKGQPVEIKGVLAQPDLPKAEGIFDYRDYLKKLGIYYTLKTDSPADWQLGANPSANPPLSDRFIAWAGKTLTRGLDPNDEATQLLVAMTLGQKTALTDEVSEPFMRSGTMHIFAISGLHIALIAGILLGLLRVAQLPRIACGAIVLPLIWFYTAATGWQPSAIRSTIMMSVVIGGWMLKRPGNLLNSLAAAAFIILLLDPLQLFQASFQLSFFVVLSIALIAPPLNRMRDKLLQSDPLLPVSLIPRWRRWLNAPLRWFTTCVTTSLAAWTGSMPLTALYFHLFSPVTLLANVIVVPLAGFALMAELGSLICGGWFLPAGELFNNAAWFFMHLMIVASDTVTKIPDAFFYVQSPSWTTIGIYFAALVVIATGWLNNSRRKIFGAAALILVCGIYFCRWELSRDETQITILPLNGGHSVFVDADGTKNDWLIDCGDEDAVNFTLKNFLRAQGVNKIHRLVLSEGEARNCGGAELLDELFGIGELWTSPVHFRSGIYNGIVSAFEKSSRHKTVNFGNLVGNWKILWPTATNDFSRADDNALVMLGSFSKSKLLLLSDLSRAGQSALLAQTNDLHADIVVSGLPNDSEPLADALIDAIQPKVIVIVDSEFPTRFRAKETLKERLAEKKIPVIYTRDSGAVKMVSDASGWKLNTMDGQEFISPIASD